MVDGPRLNLALVRRKIADIRRNVDVLRDYAQRPDDEFLNSAEAVRSARYAFIVAIEAALNVCSHISARVLKQVPESYAACFDLLAEREILQHGLAERLGAMARFRNLLVYGYVDVDDARVLEIMRDGLGDLDAYVDALRAVLGNAGGFAVNRVHRPPASGELREHVRVELGQELSRHGGVRFAFGFGSFFEGLPLRDVDIPKRFRRVGDAGSTPDPTPDLLELSRLASACERRIRLPVDIIDLAAAASLIERTWLA